MRCAEKRWLTRWLGAVNHEIAHIGVQGLPIEVEPANLDAAAARGLDGGDQLETDLVEEPIAAQDEDGGDRHQEHERDKTGGHPGDAAARKPAHWSASSWMTICERRRAPLSQFSI